MRIRVRMKTRRNISISRDLDEFIKKQMLAGSFSEWVEKKFREEFMDIESKKTELVFHQKEIEKLEKQIIEISEKKALERKILPRAEVNFLRTVKERLNKANNPKAILKHYNNEFGKKATWEEFMKLIEGVEKK